MTPAFALLIALTIPAGVSLPAETLTLVALPVPGVIVKVKALPPFNDCVVELY